VDDERGDVAGGEVMAEGGDFRFGVCSGAPAAGVAGEYLEAFTAERAGALRGLHEAAADRNVDADSHGSKPLSVHRAPRSRSSIS